MTDLPATDGAGFPSRLRVHVWDLVRLAAPVIVSRAGVLVMALVGTIMVGRYGVDELAYMAIGQAPTHPIMLSMMGLVMGTMVTTAAAFGSGRDTECGAAWRRSLPYAFGLGLVATILCLFGEPFLLATGQTPELAYHGGRVTAVLGLGIPPVLIYLTTTFFLEGMKRPLPGMLVMIGANFLNVFLNWVLVYGNLGFPAMGALGSAWATTAIRFATAVAMVAYVWTMSDHARFAVRVRPEKGWRQWTHQRRVGYGAGASIGLESLTFNALTVCAGWLGALSLAAYSINTNVIAMVFMVAIGFGVATSVRVGIAHGQHDRANVALAGWSGLGVNTVVMAVIGIILWNTADIIASAYSTDAALLAVTAPVIAFTAWIVVVDGAQGVLVNALRGHGETWVPVVLQGGAFALVMVPLAWVLAFPMGHGVLGLVEGIMAGTAVAAVLLAVRFHRLSRR
jgi:multidrug resistance protein, MATE family